MGDVWRFVALLASFFFDFQIKKEKEQQRRRFSLSGFKHISRICRRQRQVLPHAARVQRMQQYEARAAHAGKENGADSLQPV